MAGIPQVITEDRASGALVIDGSLKFNGRSGGNHGYGHLKRTSSGASGGGTFTISWWAKRGSMRDDWQYMIAGNNGSLWGVGFPGSSGERDSLTLFNGSHQYSTARFRDNSGWYHIVLSVDSDDGPRLWVNGELQSNSNSNASWNLNNTMYIGKWNDGGTAHNYDGHLAQYTCIDGLELGPSYFAYTDPLTGTWRPKKFRAEGTTVNDGTVWSDSSSDPNNVKASGDASQLFNGNLSAGGVVLNQRSTSNTAYYVALDGVSIPCNNSVAFYSANGASTATMRINGDDNLKVEATSTTNGWWALNYEGIITKIELGYLDGSGSSNTYYGIQIDGVTLIDSTTQNLAFGNAGFYLPLDGNTPIGKDQSGNGNDWEVVGFGGSVELSKATGAIPILNTNEAGTVAKGGARTDSKTYTVTASGGNYYLDGALKPTLNAYRGGSYTFDYTGATSHPFYLSSLPDGKHNSEAYSVTFDGEDSWIDIANGVTIGTSAFTWECFFYADNFKDFCTIFDTRETGSAEAGQIYVGARNDGLIYVWSGSYRIQTNRVSTGEWHHLALVKDTNNLMHLYVDGTHAYKVGGNDWTHTDSVNPLLRIGQTQLDSFVTGNDFEWEGKLSNVRITVGQALYTSNFTPPTTTLTTTSQGAIASNVKLLCCQSSSATTAAVTPGTLTTSGNAAAVNVSPFLYDNSHGFFGVNTATSNTTKITIPHWAPDTLYYYCSAHSGMGSSINVTTDIRKADPYAWLCTLAVPLTGADTSDLSSNINVTTTAMTVASSSVTSGGNRNFYGSSAFYGTNANQYRHEISANSGLSFGDRPWTIECWCYRDRETVSNTYQTLWSFRSNSSSEYHSAGWISFLINASSGLLWYYGLGSSNANFSPTETIGLNRWTHIANVWDGKGNIELYFDGIKVHTQAISKTDWGSSTLPFYIADQAWDQGGRGLSGYMQDFRIYKGVAKYTSNFVPASTSPDILPDTPSGVSGGSNLTKITDGAVHFDGSGDHLSIPDSSDFSFDGDFTVEAFVYQTAQGDHKNIFSTEDFDFKIRGNGKVRIYTANSGTDTTQSVRLNTWTHLALVRESGTIKVYFDGVGETVSQTIASDGSSAAEVGRRIRLSQEPFDGFISNLRVVKGTALYTSDFTPPTEPLTAVTNTKLLCCQSNTSATAAAVVPPNEPFSGAGGAQGGGTTSDYLKVSSSGHSDFSVDGDFTFEWWHYRAAANVNNGFMWTIGDSNTATGLELYWGTSGSALKLYTNGGPNSVTATAATGWHHYAVVRSGNTIKVYYDGTEGGSFTNTNTFSGDVRIGAEYYNGSVTGGMNGPMSQFRFVKGTAVYTSNFTAPTTALTAITNTKILTLQGSTITDASGTNKTIEVFGTVTTDVISKNGNASATTLTPFTDDINAIRGQASGYATLNPLAFYLNSLALSNGNLSFTQDSINDNDYAFGNILLNGRKIYYEFVLDFANNIPGANSCRVGICRNLNGAASEIVIYNGTGNFETLGTTDSTGASGRTYSTGDIIGLAIDCIDGSVQYFKNGVKVGTKTFTVGTDEWTPHIRVYRSTGTVTGSFNFGQKPFKFPPPDGFQPLNLSTVRPEKVIARPDQYFDVSLWTGNGTSQNITGLKHKPDFVWSKARSFGADHELYDSVRGTMKRLYSSLTTQESTASSGVNSFNADGFGVTGGGGVNNNTSTYVGWTWKAGGNKNTYNIDDVGYANASDVNMSVGALNSSLYNSSQTWSTYGTQSGDQYTANAGTYVWADVFDNLSDSPQDVGYCVYGPNQKWTFTNPISVSSSVAIAVWGLGTLTLNAGETDEVTLTSGGEFYNTITDTSLAGATLKNIQLDVGTAIYLFSVHIDGARLVDPNIAPDTPSIAPTGCSVGTKQGFSIIKYSHTVNSYQTIPHGLSQTPQFIIAKYLDGTTNWNVYHASASGAGGGAETGRFTLNNANIYTDEVDVWGDTAPTDKVWTVGGSTWQGSGNHISYLWHDVPGLQKFGKYTANNNANGPYIELGFRPALVVCKSVTQGQPWQVYDVARSSTNPTNRGLQWDGDITEYNSTDRIDILSNGFKIRAGGGTEPNVGTNTYVYCAWAEAPTVNLYGAQANAR